MTRILSLSVMMLFATTVFAQAEATTKDGRKVLLNSNGTWAYFDCAAFIKTETYTGGKVMTSAKENIKITKDGKTGLEIILLQGSESLIIRLSPIVRQVKCVSKNNILKLDFTDGTSRSLTHMNDIDCGGNFNVYLGKSLGNTADLEALKTKKIKKIAIQYTDTKDDAIVKYFEDHVVSDSEATLIQRTINCLTN